MIIERQRLHSLVVQVVFHRAPDFRQIILVNDFIALQIKRPVAGAIEQRDGLLLAIDETLQAVIAPDPLAPLCRKDSDFGVADFAQHPFRVVVPATKYSVNFARFPDLTPSPLNPVRLARYFCHWLEKEKYLLATSSEISLSRLSSKNWATCLCALAIIFNASSVLRL
jgi:hypothetical protein